MKKIVAATCVLGLLLLTCSKKSTNSPDDNNPPVRTPFSISYTADPARTASAYITAAIGGSLTAIDKDSVVIELTIPSYALKSDTTISIIPLSMLSIGGPKSSGCVGCPDADSLCCHRGALFEPSGVVLDSPVTLTVRFPSSAGFPFGHGGVLIYLDSADGSYRFCRTANDSTGGRLEARLSHFSAYGADDPSYDQQEEAIYATLDRAAASISEPMFFFTVMQELKMEYFWCSGHGDPYAPVYSDLLKLIENQSYALWIRHVNIQRDKASSATSCDAMYILDPLWLSVRDYPTDLGITFSNSADFAALSTSVKSEVAVYFGATVQEGKQLCAALSCSAGREQFSCALNHKVAIDDQALVDSVRSWLIQCCDVSISLSADKSTIYNMATSLADHSTYVNLQVWVERNLGEPLENYMVCVRGVNTTSGESFSVCGTTDIAGIARMRFVWGYGISSVSKGDYEMTASVTYGSEAHESDSVMITLAPAGVKMTYDYQYNYYYMWNPSRTETITVSIMGTGVKGWANDCPSNYQLTRYFQKVCVDPGETRTLTVNDHPGACFFYINSATAMNDEQVVISLLQSVSVEYDYPYTGYAAAISSITTPTDTLTDSVTTEHLDWWMISYVNYYTPKWGYYVLMPYNDGFQSLVWDTSGSFPYLTATTHLQIDMSVEK